MQVIDLLTPLFLFGILSLLGWGMPLGALGYDVGNVLCTRETESEFFAAYRALRPKRQISALAIAGAVTAMTWSPVPEWLQIATTCALLLAHFGLICRHMLVARRRASQL